LARSTRDLLNTVDRILKVGAGFKSLGDAWADTTTPHGRLMLTVLGGIAEFERELIMQRTGEGRARAKAEGKKLGGPKFKLTLDQQRMAMAWLDTGYSARYVARALNVNHATVCRLKARAIVARELAR
jgi:DNA invertase Pin-like site-specific DNA recombinase